MKLHLIIIGIFMLFFTYGSAQNSDAVSLEITMEQKLLEATVICLDAVEAPTVYNEFAKPFIEKPSFPQKNANSELEFRNLITAWLKNNLPLVDEILVERKKAHDKIYGYRPY